MPQTIRKYLKHTATGFGIAAALVAMLFWLDTGQLQQIVALAGGVWAAAALIWLCVGALFAAVQIILAARGGHDDDDSGPRGGGRRHPNHGDMIPVRVEARIRERR